MVAAPTMRIPEPIPFTINAYLAFRAILLAVENFNRAVRQLPVGVPVNVILLPMEGDPQAAPAFWVLALRTGGSMLAPAEAWP